MLSCGTVKTVIRCPISKITLCSDFTARENPGLPGEYPATAAIFSMLDCGIAWNLRRLLFDTITKGFILMFGLIYSGTSAPFPSPSEPLENVMALPESLAVALQINPLVSKIISDMPLNLLERAGY
jgi:hypothetical protein